MLAVAAGLVASPAFADICERGPDPVAENDAWRVTATFQAGRWRYTLFDKKTGEPVRTKPLQGIEKHAHLELHVGDDGGFAVLDPNAEHRSIDRLLVYDAAGVLRASLGIRDILTAREQAGVQRSKSHIHWLAGPPKTRTYVQVLPDRRGVRLTTLAGRQVLVSLADGSITADPEAPAAKPADRPAGRTTLDAVAAAKAAATAEPLVAFSSVVSVLLQNLREERTMTLDRVRLLRACTRRLAEQGLQTEPVRLDGLTALDTPDAVEIARLLAGAEVPLMLRNLSRASPKTLSALLETDAVEIPLIEDLEIIKEPDGSPTEDFIVPERVLERQRRQSKIE